jgi:hypothetical protein
MQAANEVWAYVVVDTVISALALAGLVLLGVLTYRIIVRTRKQVRK